MTVAIAVWSAVVTPGKPLVVETSSDLKITNISLGDELADESGRTTLKLVYHTPGADDSGSEDEDEEDKAVIEPTTTTILGSLTPGKIEQTTLNVVLEAETEYLFEVVGENTIYLTGNYIDQIPNNVPYNDDSDEDEDDYDLQDVSSDVEFEADEMDVEGDSSRFEEVHSDAEKQEKKKEEPKKANKKRAREEEASETQPSPDAKLSKAEKKKLNKKLKGEDGTAVPAGTEGTEKKEADEPKKDKKEKKEKAKKVEEGDKKSQPESRTLDGGISVTDHKAGSGQKAKKGDTVLMRYVGKLQNGKTFDSNTKGQPFRFTLGKGEVIKGWDIGIVGMQVGGERVLTIPPAMAYGKKGQGPIPANSTLRFEVKLLQIA